MSTAQKADSTLRPHEMASSIVDDQVKSDLLDQKISHTTRAIFAVLGIICLITAGIILSVGTGGGASPILVYGVAFFFTGPGSLFIGRAMNSQPDFTASPHAHL